MSGTSRGKALALVFATWLPSAGAASFQVDSVADAVDVDPGDGHCATAEGECTLRAAVQEANAWVGADVIRVPAGIYVLADPDEDPRFGALDVTDELHIVGAGPGPTVLDGNFSDRLFHVIGDTSLRLERLLLQRGQVAADDDGGHGGAVLAEGDLALSDVVLVGNTAAGHGGAIHAAGTLVLANSTLEDNTAASGGAIFVAASGTAILEESSVLANKANEGGGLYAQGPVSLRTSTLSANQADFQGGGAYFAAESVLENVSVRDNQAGTAGAGVYALGAVNSLHRVRFDANRLTSSSGNGAGLYVGDASRVTLTVGAFLYNRIDAIGTGVSHGGGLYFAGARLDAENITFSGNASDVGGGLEAAAGNVELRYSTLAANSAPTGANLAVTAADATVALSATLVAEPVMGDNCDGIIASLRYNLATDASCGLDGEGDQVVGDAGLGLLDGTGTHPLIAGSAAINAGDPNFCPVFDGAGDVRADTRCDVGAREAGAVAAEGGTLRFAHDAAEVHENVGSVTISVIREGGNVPVSVTYRTLDDTATATAGQDYQPLSGELSWAADDHDPKDITLTVFDDDVHEPTETLQLVLNNARGGAVSGAPSIFTVTLIDDDPEPVDPEPEEPLPPEEPEPEIECMPNHPHCLPPGLAKKAAGAFDWVLLLAGVLFWGVRCFQRVR